MMGKRIAVFGAGSWGTALAIALARNCHDVVLWSWSQEQIMLLRSERENKKYLPGIHLNENISFESDLALALTEIDLLVLALPSHVVCQWFDKLKDYLPEKAGILIASKGIDPGTGKFLPDAVAQQNNKAQKIALMSGPSFAKELAQGLPTALTIASSDLLFAQYVAEIFHHASLRPYLNQDVIGTALGGTIKNIIAIAAGISDGLGFGANAKSALITRGLAEIIRLGKAMGAKTETLFGLSGLGDLILTCTDNQSRNRRFGLLLGQGMSAETAKKKQSVKL